MGGTGRALLLLKCLHQGLGARRSRRAELSPVPGRGMSPPCPPVLSWAVGTQGQTVPCQPEILLCSEAMPNSCNTTGFGPLILFFPIFFPL